MTSLVEKRKEILREYGLSESAIQFFSKYSFVDVLERAKSTFLEDLKIFLKDPTFRRELKLAGVSMTDLKRIVRVGKNQIGIEEESKKREMLEQWGVDRTSQVASILIKHWKATLQIRQSCDADIFEKVMQYTDAMPKFLQFIETSEDLIKIGLFLVRNKRLSTTILAIPFFKEVNSKEKLFEKFKEYERLVNDKRYWTVQGLTSMGFLSVHVTNAFAGGVLGRADSREDPFKNIENDIRKVIDYNPSVSVIHPKFRPFLVRSGRSGINGSIGVVYDYGYIYEAYPSDIGHSGRQVVSKTGIARRTGDSEYQSDVALILNYPINSHYNEFFLRNWTVSGIFYTQGCQQSVIDRLKDLCKKLSFNQYINGEYFYRKVNLGVPAYIEKIFPLYEINPQNRKWKIVYTTKK